MRMKKHTNQIMGIVAAMALMLIVSCARMGQPDGGWYDENPPKVIRTSPQDRATEVTNRKINIYFDEFIKLEDATNKVVVSPPQLEMPEIATKGKRIVIELKDTLQQNTTYTVDFSDAIVDNNEGNPMGSYTYCFSTGTEIDTFEVAGTVITAENLEPVKGILVGLHSDLSDTVFAKKPLRRVARTDSRGRFTIKGVAPGSYRVYALNDMDGDYVYSQRSEMLAFSHRVVVPSCKPDIRQDTVWRDTLHIDSIARIPYIHFLPDDIVLRSFVPEQTERYLLKTERTDHRKIGVYFTGMHDSLPVVKGLNFDAEKAFFVEASPKKDTLTYWLRDTTLINRDSLEMVLSYYATDTTGMFVMKADTLTAIPKMSFERREKLRLKELEKWEKQQEKKKKRREAYDSIYPVENVKVKMLSKQVMDPDKNVVLEMETPLAFCDTASIHLKIKVDSLFEDIPCLWQQIPQFPRRFMLLAEWRPDNTYSLEIDSAAFVDIYGQISNPIKQNIKIRPLDDYGSLTVNMSKPDSIADSTVIVQLLNNADNPIKEARLDQGNADFFFILPGTYYLRAIIDSNGNGKWDTGDYYSNTYPEMVVYDPRAVNIKAKWDTTHQWNISERPLDRQKPGAIIKQKADKEKKRINKNAQRREEMNNR
ncbi:MAG: Ig-like domain-containing protein [Prevotella sp.]